MDGVAGGEIAVYEAGNGETRLEVRLEQDTVWLDQERLAQLFGRDKSVIGKHLRAVYREGELDREATAADFAQVRSEGARTITRQIEHYNLDAILSVGYRVKSKRGVQFRIWATNTLREHLVRGYTLNERRLAERGLDAAYYRELARSSQTNQRRGDPIRFLLYALQGLSDGLREQCRAVTRVHHETAWRDFVYRRFDEEELSSAMLRRRRLILDLPPVSDPLTKEQIPIHSVRLARSYASMNPKTLDRDLNWLLEDGLVVRAGGGYAANRDLMQAFVVPGAPEGRK